MKLLNRINRVYLVLYAFGNPTFEHSTVVRGHGLIHQVGLILNVRGYLFKKFHLKFGIHIMLVIHLRFFMVLVPQIKVKY